MAKLRDSLGRKNSNSAYVRLFGDTKFSESLGDLLSKTHATVIRSGNDLEKYVIKHVPTAYIVSLADLKIRTIPTVVYKPSLWEGEPDFIVIRDNITYVIEIKAGDNFDTKKSEAELERIQKHSREIATRFKLETDYRIVTFYQENKQISFSGFKGYVPINKIMTGTEFCALLNVDYHAVIEDMQQDIKDNELYVREILEDILKIKD